jgi:hypothetical protein
MAHTCSKCSRVNPAEAVYCYYDGIALNGHAGSGGGPVAIGQKAFSSPFTLPSGKQCQNFDQLALGCQEDWKAAVDVLKQGYLEKFLANQGRADLAMAAREAARFPDKDRGLAQFLEKLPTQALQPPKLVVEPTEINLGTLKGGEDRKMELKLENQGMRLVYGSATVDKNGNWLSLGSAAGAAQKLFQFGSETTIPITVQGKRLRASNKPLEAKIVIESNAGDYIINVKAEVPVKPYPSGALAGARSPRQIAEKAKASPKDAAMEFEKGNVAQWYKDNGWPYPVKLPSASGLGAVQQFFEALGLTPPPKVEVGKKAINMTADVGGQVRETLEIKSQEKRPVYAHATSDQPWLEIGKALLNGRIASIPLRVSNVPNRPGETLKAKLQVTSNGNQKFVIPVTLTIGGGGPVFGFDAPMAVADTPLVSSYKRKGRRPPLWPLILLLLCLGGVAAWDILGAAKPPDAVVNVDAPTETVIVEAPKDKIIPLDTEPRIAVSFAEDTSRFGVSCTKLKDPRYADRMKLLTSHEKGMNNNTRILVDGYDFRFGMETPNVRYLRDKKGNLWKEREVKNPITGGRQFLTIMDWKNENMRVTQSVEIVVSETTRYYDTALIKYTIENADKTRSHTIGIRILFDTFIGAEDGVPFEIGPSDEVKVYPGMVSKKAIFEKNRVPQYIRAIENPNDLGGANNTIAEMGLKLKGFEPIQKLVLCRWPKGKGEGQANWDWEFDDIDVNPQDKDSCVVIYWSKIVMPPSDKRICGFTYGLGRIAGEYTDEEKKTVIQSSKMRLFTRPAVVNKEFVVSAYMRGADGQNVKIELPPEMTLVDTKQEQPVKTEAGKQVAQVSWIVKCSKKGDYVIKATLTDGTKAAEPIRVNPDGIFN